MCPWKPQEDAIIFKLSIAHAAELLGRTRATLTTRKQNLRYPQAKVSVNAHWDADEAAMRRALLNI